MRNYIGGFQPDGVDNGRTIPPEGIPITTTSAGKNCANSTFKPCPFCGSADAVAIVQDDPIGPMPSNRYRIGCSSCGVWFDNERCMQNLIKKWNKRA